MYDVVKKSDVFVQSFRKGVAERLGFNYEDLSKRNSDVVYGAATGYGPEDSHNPAFACTGDARYGAASWTRPHSAVGVGAGCGIDRLVSLPRSAPESVCDDSGHQDSQGHGRRKLEANAV